MYKKYFSLWVPVLIWCSVIFFFSSIPNLKTEFGFWDLILRKAAHITEYAILFLLLRRAVARTYPDLKDISVYFISGIFSILYAFSDEFHQYFVVTRGPSLADVMIDSIGGLIGLAAYLYWKKVSLGNNK
ncbi:MAG: VanZ family protein [Elusimicrobia bacterium]|nr:VanZ family protein [Elusimicrobiota bacterium]